MILTLLIRYNRVWSLWDEASRSGDVQPSPESIEHINSEFVPMMMGFSAGWLFFTAAASVCFVGLVRMPVCRGKRYAA